MRKQKFKLVVGIISIILASVVMATPVNALQSRPDGTSLKNTTAIAFFTKIRQMESTVLGLETNFAATTWLDSSGNGVDVHMAKNTEWGTAAMLSASAYGTAPSGTSSATTTGNATGVYQMADGTSEYVMGIKSNANSTLTSANSRYSNLYGSVASIVGDATTETAGWYGSASDSLNRNQYVNIYTRGNGGLFGHNATCDYYTNTNTSSRAVMVIGEGL